MATAPYAKTEQALTTLTRRMMGRLDEYARHREISRAEAIRRFIEEGLDRAERPTE